MSRLFPRFHDLLTRLAKTLHPENRRPTKQTKAARELTYLDPPDGAPAGGRRRR
jgi:hypothetical protein